MKVKLDIYKKILYPPFKLLSTVAYPEENMGSFHSHSIFQTVIVLEGALYFKLLDGKEIKCSPGELLSIPPGVAHSWLAQEPCRTIQATHRPMTLDLYGELYTVFGLVNDSIRKISFPVNELANATKMIEDEIRRPSKISSVLLHARLLEIFALAVRELRCGTVVKSRSEQAVQNAINYIENNLNKKISLSQLSSIIHLSDSRFSHVFREYTGKPPIQYINDLRIERAETLLVFSEMNVSEVAAFLGFDSIYYFSRLFKRLRGVSPSAYVSLHKKKQDCAKERKIGKSKN
jgi:AraC-like DNA-binding protein